MTPFLFHKGVDDFSTPFKKGTEEIDKKWVPKAPLFEKDMHDPFEILPSLDMRKEQEELIQTLENQKSLRDMIKD